MSYPVIRILEGHDRRLRQGSPWLFSNELQIDRHAKELAPGTIVRLVSHDGKAMALAHFNAHSLIAARLLSRNPDRAIDSGFLRRRVERALALRERLFDVPYYRLLHAEADGLPGLVCDRYGDLLVAQLNSAGMDGLRAELEAALLAATGAARLLFRSDAQMREREGLPAEPSDAEPAPDADTTAPAGSPDEAATVIVENGLRFAADPRAGQKTGWYYDQRLNRRFAAGLARDATVLDLYSYAGGFGLTALAHGARSAMLVDRSAAALALATHSARLQGCSDRIETVTSEAFEALDRLGAERRRFGLVIADPPAFVRSRKELPTGLKGYQKLARGAATLVAEAGFLGIACCSHNVPEDQFLKAVHAGIRAAGRSGILLHRAGAGPDHPVHPALPESAYLKFLVFVLD